MVLSFAGLKFREDHLELNSHPKDLHRDYHIRRVSYGNGTHLNISGEGLLSFPSARKQRFGVSTG